MFPPVQPQSTAGAELETKRRAIADRINREIREVPPGIEEPDRADLEALLAQVEREESAAQLDVRLQLSLPRVPTVGLPSAPAPRR